MYLRINFGCLKYWKYGYFSDISGNWSANPNYVSENYQFITDISIDGLSKKNSAIIFIPDYSVYEVITKVECYENILRIYATRCPLSETKCRVQIFDGDGSTEIVYSGCAVTDTNFIVTITNDEDADIYSADCSFSSIKSAYQRGRNVILRYNEASYFLSSIDDRMVCFARIYTNISASEMVIESFLIRGTGSAKYFKTAALTPAID